MREISTDGGWTGEIDFARIVREHKGTIYTVCYMFSKDKADRKKRRNGDARHPKFWNRSRNFRMENSLTETHPVQFIELHGMVVFWWVSRAISRGKCTGYRQKIYLCG